MPNYDKYVPFVTTKPIEYKSSIGGDHGEEIRFALPKSSSSFLIFLSFDVKVKVLSSHHEDNFFRLHFQVWDPLEKSPFKPLSMVSAAIKVISKPLKPKPPKGKVPLTSLIFEKTLYLLYFRLFLVPISPVLPRSGRCRTWTMRMRTRVMTWPLILLPRSSLSSLETPSNSSHGNSGRPLS